MVVPAIRVCGHSDSGKTTMIELLVPALARHGLRVGTVKHAHKGFDIDHEGKDSWRHCQAGTAVTTVIGPYKSATVFASELQVDEALAQMAGRVDLVLIEGYKELDLPAVRTGQEGPALKVAGRECDVAVFPSELNTAELETLCQFCIAVSKGGIT